MIRIDGQTKRRVARVAIMAAIAGLVPAAARAGEGLTRLSTLLGRKPATAAEAKPRESHSAMNWWSIPRPARVAAKKLAKSQDASVTRCVAIDQDDKVSYEIHASHHLGLFKRDDFVLTGVSEPKAVAEKRREEQTLRRRMERLRDAGASAVKGKPANDNDGGQNQRGSSVFPIKD